MDARTPNVSLKSPAAGRRVTQGTVQAFDCLRAQAIGRTARRPANGRERDRLEMAQVFKKTSCVADLKPGGRDVAKDMVEFDSLIDADHGTRDAKLTHEKLTAHPTEWTPRATDHNSGTLWKYVQQVGAAIDGVVALPRRAHEKQCYANI